LTRLLKPAALIAAILLSAGCRMRESPEAARAKASKVLLENQLVSLRQLLGRSERGELVTSNQIAIGIDEDVARQILNAPLPREQAVGGHVTIRIERAEPLFRGNQAGLVFQARATSVDVPDHFAALELAGSLADLKLEDGRLAARVALNHFSVREASVGPLGQGLLENLVRGHLETIQQAIPAFEVPVHLDQRIRLASFNEGPVSAAGGELPLAVAVSEVLPVNQRLWVLIDAKVGPWVGAKP
jgi:hypothetical protein